MHPKLILAFLAGAALASSLMYLGMKRLEQAAVAPVAGRPARITEARIAPAPVKAHPLEELTPKEETSPAPPTIVRRHTAKPSAMPTLRQDPVKEARNLPPAPVAQHPEPEIAPPPPQLEAVSNPPVPPASVTPPDLAMTDPGPPPPHEVILKAGAQLKVRIGETLSANRNKPGDHFLTTLEEPLVIDDFVIAEKGSRIEGEVVTSDKAGRAGGMSHLAIRLVMLETADRQSIPIQTLLWNRYGQSTTGRDAATILASTAIGAAIGAMAGGGKGAGIGAAAGGAAGTAGVLIARGPECSIPVETRISFQVQESVTISERLN